MKKILISTILSISFLFAAAPTCHPAKYCQYTGKVQRIYVNHANHILVYFDTAIDPKLSHDIGYNNTRNNAAIVDANENKIFADYFYSTLLTAQASNREITIQMRGVLGGYLKADRIFLTE